jgi:hypothetical protein
VTISLYTIAEGAAYAPFVQRWWDSVSRMNPMPDEVVLVIGADDKAGVRNIVPEADPVRIITLSEPFSNRYFSAGADACSSEWIGFCGIDDLMLPSAYKDVPQASAKGAEIMVGTIILSNGVTWQGVWNPDVLQRHNTLPAHSPFRKSLYSRVAGFPDIHWSDWGFWMKCAQHGATVMHSPQPIAIFDIGENRETMSGVGLPDHKRAAADKELQDFAGSL